MQEVKGVESVVIVFEESEGFTPVGRRPAGRFGFVSGLLQTAGIRLPTQKAKASRDSRMRRERWLTADQNLWKTASFFHARKTRFDSSRGIFAICQRF
jgi:hypothetical protein